MSEGVWPFDYPVKAAGNKARIPLAATDSFKEIAATMRYDHRAKESKDLGGECREGIAVF